MPSHMTFMCFNDDSNMIDSLDRFLEFTFSLLQKQSINFCFVGTARNDKWLDELFFRGAVYTKFFKRLHTSSLCLTANITKDEIEKSLKNVDVIFVGGGDPEPMLKIWQQRGFIDVLNEMRAKDKLPLLTGVSAGAMYLFQKGISDSIPKQYTSVDGMGWFPQSCTPHTNWENKRACDFDDYNIHDRMSAYQAAIAKKLMPPGYAIPDNTMLHFYDNKCVGAYSALEGSACSFVTATSITPLESTLLTRENASLHAHDALQKLDLEARDAVKEEHLYRVAYRCNVV